MEEGDRSECERIMRSRKTAVSKARRAQMLVLAARGLSNRQIALKLGASAHVVGRVRKEYGRKGLAVLKDRPRPGRPRSSRDEQSIRKVVETVCQAPAKGLSRWSARTLGRHLNIASATVNRILRENKLQPHRLRTFTFSPDPQFGEKLLEVVALYMKPPDNAVVLCMDEKTGIQALDRTQPMYGMGRARSWPAWILPPEESLLMCASGAPARISWHFWTRWSKNIRTNGSISCSTISIPTPMKQPPNG